MFLSRSLWQPTSDTSKAAICDLSQQLADSLHLQAEHRDHLHHHHQAEKVDLSLELSAAAAHV